MRILWISHRDGSHPSAGGAEVHLEEVTVRLAAAGHEVTILTEGHVPVRRQVPPSEVDSRVRIRRGGSFSLHLIAPAFVRKNSENFDVIVDDLAHAVPFGSSMVTSRPVVAWVHHVHQKVLRYSLAPPAAILVAASERCIPKIYDSVVAVSDSTSRELQKTLKVPAQRISVIRYGVDHQTFRPGSKCTSPTILVLTGLKRYKNIDHIIRATHEVRATVPDVRLVVGGLGPEERHLRRLVTALGLDDCVQFRGWVTGADRVRLLQEAWCIAYTSVTEGWGLGILEAAACGTTAVVYDSGALAEAVSDGRTGLVCPYGDLSRLSEAFTRILSNREVAASLSRQAYSSSLDFSWEKSTQQTLRYLETKAR